MLREDLAKKFKISPNRLVFKNLVAGRSVDRFPRFRPPERAIVAKLVVNGLALSSLRSPFEACGVRCVFFASKRERAASATPPRASAITPRARGPPHSLLSLSGLPVGMRKSPSGRVSNGSCRSVLVDLYILEPQSSVEKANELERSSFGRSSIRSQFTRRTPRKHRAAHTESARRKHTQKAYAEIARAGAHTHRNPPKFLLIVSAPDVPFELRPQQRACTHHICKGPPMVAEGRLRRPHSLKRNRCYEPNAVGHVEQRIKRRAHRSVRARPARHRKGPKEPTCSQLNLPTFAPGPTRPIRRGLLPASADLR